MVKQKIVRGDYVQVPDLYNDRVGQAGYGNAMSGRKRGRWVVWRDRGGHWASGFYESNRLVFVDTPDPYQASLKL